jgi:hypothetical protein
MKLRHAIQLLSVILGCLAFVLTPISDAWSSGPVVVDGNGKEIGPYVSALQCGPEGVLLKLSGVWVNVPVNRSGFDNCGGFLFYESADCTGKAFVGADLHTPSMTDWSPIVAGSTIYYGDPAAREDVTTHSRRSLDRSVRLDKCETALVKGTLLRAMTFDLSTLKYIPPFSISTTPN